MQALCNLNRRAADGEKRAVLPRIQLGNKGYLSISGFLSARSRLCFGSIVGSKGPYRYRTRTVGIEAKQGGRDRACSHILAHAGDKVAYTSSSFNSGHEKAMGCFDPRPIFSRTPGFPCRPKTPES